MKPIGSKFKYSEDRNLDLMKVYHEQISRCKIIRVPELMEQIVNSPSNRFWISENRAAIVISEMIRGDKLEYMSAMKREMFLEIYSRVIILQKKYPFAPLIELVRIVTVQPAPKFYLTPQSAKIIIHKIKKKWYKERMRKLRHLF